MTWLYILLGILATWRLTYDFVALEGPFGLYDRIRGYVKGKGDRWPTWVVDGVDCGYCVSFWAGFLVATVMPWSSWQEYLLFALGISGAVTLFARYVKAMYGADLFE